MGNYTHNLGRETSGKGTTWKPNHGEKNNTETDIGKKYGAKVWIQLDKQRVQFRPPNNIPMHARVHKTDTFQTN
jgi:hypothetical protein